jgi:arylsulfatase A-like enzyme
MLGDHGDPPPIILISIDTLRADRLPIYGYTRVATPNLDALALTSVRFENAWTPCPTTLCAHSSALTGLDPTLHGVRDNIGYQLDTAAHPTLPQRLGDLGYESAAFVSAYVLRARTGLGDAFSHYDDGLEIEADRSIGHLERPGPRTVKAALAWLDRRAGSPRPLFLFVHLFEPHTPYAPPEPFASRYQDPYDGEIAAADAALGELLDGLESRGILDPALVILFADHGEGLGDHGEEEHGILLHRETLRVPLLVKWPAGASSASRGEANGAPVSLVDIAPTVLELVGVPAPKPLSGISLLAVSDGETERRVYGETYYPRLHFGWSELLSLVDSRHHLIAGPAPELYDLELDPGETRNLIAEQPDVAEKLAADLARRETPLIVPGTDDIEKVDAARLAALGYVTGVVATPDRRDNAAGKAAGLPDPKAALPALAGVQRAFELGRAGRHHDAAQLLERLIGEFPGMLDARFQLASSLAAQGDVEAALRAYREILDISPQARSGVMIEIARIEARRGRLDDAEAAALEAALALPAEANEILAQVALARGDLVGALALAQRAVAAEQVPRPESMLLLGRLLVLDGKLAQALATFDALRQRITTGQREPIRGLELERGETLARLERYFEAEAAFHDEIDAFPGHLRAYSRLAILSVAMGRPEAVDPLLAEMIAATPDRPEAYRVAAETVESLGDAAGAQRWRQLAAAAGAGH